ncbi:MAG: transketolase [Microgenomates group bacterium Gr01-1014_7]|nr:MAG: transketolase [Microgenomates group bacterium Gr01-1014_7]
MNKITAPKRKYQDMRDAFFEELFQIASIDRDVILLMADQGAQTMKKFEEKIPDQLINVGIAEQNMISVAAGLALCGKKVFVHAIANFTTLRCYEQIKVDLSIMNLPVTIAGVGAGFTYGSDGPTHHANQDIAAMRAIPGIRILNASDIVSLSAFPHLAYQIPKLTYIRFDKGNYIALYNKNHNFLDGMYEVVKGTDTVIISTGIMVHQAVKIANQFKSKVGVIDIYQLKPLNEEKLHKLLSSYKKIVVLEEHLSYGGLATIVADMLADYSLNKGFLRIGLPDENIFIYGDRNYMHKQIGISYPQIIKKIDKFLKDK